MCGAKAVSPYSLVAIGRDCMGDQGGVASSIQDAPGLKLRAEKTWRLFLVALAIVILGFVLQLWLPHWEVNPQTSLATVVTVEIARAALCFFIFGTRWMTRGFSADRQSLFISSAFLSLGLLTIARLLTFPGMPMAGGYSELAAAPYFGTYSNFSDSLYYDIVIRASLGTALLVGALISSDRPVPRARMMYYPLGFIGCAVVAATIISAFDHYLPVLYVQGQGMTALMEYFGIAIIAITLVSAIVYASHAGKKGERSYLLVSLGLLVMTEAQFSFYQVTTPLDAFLLVGRVMALIAWFVIFLGIVGPSLIRPYLHLEGARREIDIASADLAALSRSIMERREAEEKILALNAQLERKARELEASNRELESFCYSVSHDLRAPLRGIDGFSRLLVEEEGAKLTPQGKDYITRMRGGCQRMAMIIDDLLKLSRVVREEIVFREFDLSALVKSVANDIKAANPGRNLEFESCGSEIVDGDERLLRIAVENLLQNAWKFTSKTRHPKVEFGVKEFDGQRVFFVKDNGAGFDMQYYPKLFRPFERLHTESEFPGTGVGLASVQRVVERHGGKIWAEGKVGEGATFYFTLGKRNS